MERSGLERERERGKGRKGVFGGMIQPPGVVCFGEDPTVVVVFGFTTRIDDMDVCCSNFFVKKKRGGRTELSLV